MYGPILGRPGFAVFTVVPLVRLVRAGEDESEIQGSDEREIQGSEERRIIHRMTTIFPRSSQGLPWIRGSCSSSSSSRRGLRLLLVGEDGAVQAVHVHNLSLESDATRDSGRSLLVVTGRQECRRRRCCLLL